MSLYGLLLCSVKPRPRILLWSVHPLTEFWLISAEMERQENNLNKIFWEYAFFFISTPFLATTDLQELSSFWQDRVMGEWKNKENMKSTNWLQKETIKSSHDYTGKKKPNFISVGPACLCSSDTAQADQNQHHKYYLSDCRGESPCLFLSVFISTFFAECFWGQHFKNQNRVFQPP